MNRLTSRQEAFCREYVIRKDAKASAIAAGYSIGRAKQSGFDLLQKEHITAEICRLQALRDAEFTVKAADVLGEIAAVAMSDIGRVLSWGWDEVEDDDGKPVMQPFCHVRPSMQMTEHERRGIKSMTISRNGTFRIRFHDKSKALELLGRHLGVFERGHKRKRGAAPNGSAQRVADCQAPR